MGNRGLLVLSPRRQVLWETRRLDEEMKVSLFGGCGSSTSAFVSRLLRNAENSETPGDYREPMGTIVHCLVTSVADPSSRIAVAPV